MDNSRLPLELRDQLATFQDWLVALETAFKRKDLNFKLRYVADDELSPDLIGVLENKSPIQADDLSQNRQTEEIKRALTVLDSVDRLNQTYAAAIDLPSVRTPSQLKTFYEPIMDTEGVDIMDQQGLSSELAPTDTAPSFALPDFGKASQVTGAAIGSATHELMQRLNLSETVTMKDLTQALSQVAAEDKVKKSINLAKIQTFFDTDLGQLILANQDKLRREAPFAMLTQDPLSKEDFVVRGIVDGYLLFEDRIVLFDYKTDRFTNPLALKDRYKGQMALYAQALSQSYQIDKVDKYLVLLGGDELQVVEV